MNIHRAAFAHLHFVDFQSHFQICYYRMPRARCRRRARVVAERHSSSNHLCLFVPP